MSDKGEYYKTLLEGRLQSYISFDKAILALASGGLALTLTFTNSTQFINCATLLIIAWGFFVGSILSTIFSFFAAQAAHTEALKKHKNREYTINKCFETITKILNAVSMSLFVGAVILTIIFTSINLKEKERSMSDDPKFDREGKTAGVIPPTEPGEGDQQSEGIIPPLDPDTSSGTEGGGDEQGGQDE